MTNNLGYARLGVIVPKRNEPKAVGRNQLKRQVREWFRNCQRALNNVDLLVRVVGTASEGAEIRRNLEKFTATLG